jgi:hypothetical protein
LPKYVTALGFTERWTPTGLNEISGKSTKNMKRNIGMIIMALGIVGFAIGCKTEKDQADYPQVIRQPVSHLAKLGSSVELSVDVANDPCTYQWLLNGANMAGQNDPTLRIAKVEVKDAGFYACEVFKGVKKVVTPAANLEVYTTSIDPHTGLDPITVYGAPEIHSSTIGSCPGKFAGYVNYTPPATNGWGWTPDTNDYTTFTAADGTTATNTKVTYIGWSGDGNCAQTSVSIPNPPQSTNYQFYIYFSRKVPTTNYPIVLTGFYP